MKKTEFLIRAKVSEFTIVTGDNNPVNLKFLYT